MWYRDGGIPQGCPLSIIFILLKIGPRLHPDNLNGSSCCSLALFDAARFTVQYVRAVGQEVSLLVSVVLLSTSEAVRRAMRSWDISGDARPWSFELAVRDLEEHSDFFWRRGRVHCPVGCVRLLMVWR